MPFLSQIRRIFEILHVKGLTVYPQTWKSSDWTLTFPVQRCPKAGGAPWRLFLEIHLLLCYCTPNKREQSVNAWLFWLVAPKESTVTFFLLNSSLNKSNVYTNCYSKRQEEKKNTNRNHFCSLSLLSRLLATLKAGKCCPWIAEKNQQINHTPRFGS